MSAEFTKVFADVSCLEVEEWLRKINALIVKRKRGVITALFPTGVLAMIVCAEGGENAD